MNLIYNALAAAVVIMLVSLGLAHYPTLMLGLLVAVVAAVCCFPQPWSKETRDEDD